MADNSKLNEVANNFSIKSMFTLSESAATAMSYTLTANLGTYSNFTFELLDVRLELSSAATTSERFTVTMDSTLGATYDMLMYYKDMSGVKDAWWVPDRPAYFSAGDSLVFAYDNTDRRTYGLAIKYRRLA